MKTLLILLLLTSVSIASEMKKTEAMQVECPVDKKLDFGECRASTLTGEYGSCIIKCVDIPVLLTSTNYLFNAPTEYAFGEGYNKSDNAIVDGNVECPEGSHLSGKIFDRNAKEKENSIFIQNIVLTNLSFVCIRD